jgi:hypothetical protein
LTDFRSMIGGLYAKLGSFSISAGCGGDVAYFGNAFRTLADT